MAIRASAITVLPLPVPASSTPNERLAISLPLFDNGCLTGVFLEAALLLSIIFGGNIEMFAAKKDGIITGSPQEIVYLWEPAHNTSAVV